MDDCTVKAALGDLPIPRMFQRNDIAENRFLLYLAITPAAIPDTGYMGLFHASYDDKFTALPRLRDLRQWVEDDRLLPNRVICPCIDIDYINHLQSNHRGFALQVESILQRCGIPIVSDRPGPMCNSFFAHVDVWKAFLRSWLKCFIAAQDIIEVEQMETLLMLQKTWVPKPWCAPAYLLERITTGIFAAAKDLEVTSITDENGQGYVAQTDERLRPVDVGDGVYEG